MAFEACILDVADDRIWVQDTTDGEVVVTFIEGDHGPRSMCLNGRGVDDLVAALRAAYDGDAE